MYGYQMETPEHKIGAVIEQAADWCACHREAKVMRTVHLSNNRECVIAAYRPTPAKAPDPKAP